jgi:aerobic-type carbon monoxide dehydrogenase small subunit (CoxS/CutS family)
VTHVQLDGNAHVTLTCNGVTHNVAAPPGRLLIEALREDLGLTGTKLGCGTGDCGACTVTLDDRPVNSCLVYACECEGAQVETIEAVARSSVAAVLAEELATREAVQCGACTPGMVVMAVSFLNERAEPVEPEAVREALEGNLCRCTGYLSIIDAVTATSRRVHGGAR